MVKLKNNPIYYFLLILILFLLIRNIYYLYLIQFENCRYTRGLFFTTIQCDD